MDQPIKKARKLRRDVAKRQGLFYYDNGIACAAGHTPIIRMTSTGGCYHCWQERRAVQQAEAAERSQYPTKYYYRLKRKDGTFDVVGPFSRRITAINQYRKRYEAEWGEPLPAYVFGSDLEDSDE